MQTVKILHCADLHIGAGSSFLGERAESRRFETLLTFEKIVNTARENDVQIMLIAGDLFHSNSIESSFTDRVFDAINSIPEIKVVFAAGNHDPLSADSPFGRYRLPDNLYIMSACDDCKTFEDLRVRVYGKSFKEVYCKGEDRFSLHPPQDDFINLMCIHGELKSDLNSNYNSITSDFIANSGMDYIALGHVHKRTDIGKIGNTYCAYCGCPEGQGFDELGEKGIYIGEVSKQECNLQFMPTAKRMHLCETVEVEDCTTSAGIAEKVLSELRTRYPDNYTENLYKIILSGSTDEALEINTAEIASRINDTVYYAKVRDNTQPAIDYSVLAAEKSLKGIFVKNMLEKIENADDTQKESYKTALALGLKAFRSEVVYDEN